MLTASPKPATLRDDRLRRLRAAEGSSFAIHPVKGAVRKVDVVMVTLVTEEAPAPKRERRADLRWGRGPSRRSSQRTSARAARLRS
jgi:hypothetical protein